MTAPLRLPWNGFHVRNSATHAERSADTPVRLFSSHHRDKEQLLPFIAILRQAELAVTAISRFKVMVYDVRTRQEYRTWCQI